MVNTPNTPSPAVQDSKDGEGAQQRASILNVAVEDLTSAKTAHSRKSEGASEATPTIHHEGHVRYPPTETALAGGLNPFENQTRPIDCYEGTKIALMTLFLIPVIKLILLLGKMLEVNERRG